MNDNLRYPHFSKVQGPDLRALAQAYGGYSKITADAWRRFDAHCRWWTAWVRRGEPRPRSD